MFVRFIAPLAAALLVSCCLAEDEWRAPERAAGASNPIISDQHSVAAGKVVYRKQCQSCHGALGKGDGPGANDLKVMPSDLSDSGLWSESDGALFWKITHGRKPMPAFSKLLTDEQRWQVVNYIRTLAPRPTTQASSNEGDSK
jgi:mono/diheme cytochrome c family protein